MLQNKMFISNAQRYKNRNTSEGGYALILAIVVLGALLAIATPFLLTARASSKSSVTRAGDVRARVEADSATAALMRRLEANDCEVDITPVFDTEDEARLSLTTPSELYPLRDGKGAVVSASAEPEQNRIDINSASPNALAVILGRGFLTSDLKKDATEISVDDGSKFPDKGFLWIRGELIQYQQKKGSAFLECARQQMAGDAGPYEPAKDYRTGTPVLDARAHAVAKYRVRANPGTFRPFTTVDELTRVKMEPPNCPPITTEDLRKVRDKFTVYGERHGHDDWSAPQRITTPLAVDGMARIFKCESGRYFGIGTTVKITTPEGEEYGLVVENSNRGIVLEEPFTKNAAAYQATIQFLIPAPVHLQSTPPELLEELLAGLDVERAGTPEPLDRELVKKIIAKIKEKPITSWQNLIDSVFIPLAKEGSIKVQHIQAILTNAEHSNDRTLKFSTVPFTLTTGSRYRIVTGASVNSPAGTEWGRAETESVVEVHPQVREKNELGIRAIARQIEFDDMFRLSRRGRDWMTYPYNSSAFDGSANPPSRTRSYLNALAQLAEAVPFVQSDDPDKSWAQLLATRDAFPDQYSLHFDADLTMEGHDVRTLGAWRGSATAAPAQFALQNPNYVYPGSISGWVRFDAGSITGTIFDMGSTTSAIRDRISLAIEKGDLVARVRDSAGDDNNGIANVAGAANNEIRYPVSNIKQNVWYHFTIAFRGSGPSDWALFVDGIPRGKQGLVTRLTTDLPTLTQLPSYPPIPVEDASGFPGFGVLKIGGELVEYTGKNGNSFITTRPTGNVPGAYTGGRGARDSFDANPNLSYLYEHKSGDTVEFYGYSCKLMRDVQNGGGSLKAGIGKFTAAHVSRIQSGNWFTTIEIATLPGGPGGGGGAFPLGKGVEAGVTIPSLRLVPVDVMEPNSGGAGTTCDTDFIKAFSPAGGYAVMFQFQGVGSMQSSKGSTLFGAEVIQYGGVSGTDSLVNVTRITQPTNYFTTGAFVFDWQQDVPQGHKNNNHQFWTYVVPCSIATSGGTYEIPQQTLQNASTYIAAQLIELGGSGVGIDTTSEWFNYDTYLNGELCVFASWRWQNARGVTLPPPQITINPNGNPPVILTFGNTVFPNPPAAGCPPYQASAYTLGDPPNKGIPSIAREIADGGARTGQGIRFRGTNNTYSRDHFNTTEIIPCFLTYYGSIFGGRPGRNDRIRYMFPQGITFGPFDPYLTINWTAGYNTHQEWVATKERIPAPVPIGQTSVYSSEVLPAAATFEDSRNFWRIVKTPSGELPSETTTIAVGGRFDGPGDEVAGTIDEVEFTTPFLTSGQITLAKLIVDKAFTSSAKSFLVNPVVGSVPYNVSNNPVLGAAALPGCAKTLGGQAMATMPADAGILLIGEELIGYDTYDAASGTVNVAANGRGLLGTVASSHGAHETAVFLDHLVVTQLAGNANGGASRIPFEDANGFPNEGTLLIGSELIHYTRQEAGAFSMPEFTDDAEVANSDTSGTIVNLKRKGDGIFRGRYGSIPATHDSGEIIFRFPYRYWDRWVLGADAPEMSYIQMDERMERGFWRRVYWQEELPMAGVSLECLARIDARSPWTAQANNSDGLWLYTKPNDTEKPNRIGRLGERVELRFGVRYGLGSFSPIQPPVNNATVRSDAWKTTPRLRAIVTERFGESKVLRKEERR